LLQLGREEAAADLAVANPRALRPLVGRLWDPDGEIRGRAARALGQAAAAHPKLGREIIRRLLWALNDESGTNGVYGVAALGEIGRRAPEMLAPFIPSLVSMAWDRGIRLELLRALRAVADSSPGLVAGQLDRLAAFVDDSQNEERKAFDLLMTAVGKESGHGH
jgi:HEAT repeat protein